MALRLLYDIYYQNYSPGFSPPNRIQFTVKSVGTNPQARIYKVGTSPTTFQPIPPSGSNFSITWLLESAIFPSSGDYRIDYKDDSRAEMQVIVINVWPLGTDPCFPAFAVTIGSVDQGYTVRSLAGTSASLNGGVSFKSTGSTALWTNAEIPETIPSLIVRQGPCQVTAATTVFSGTPAPPPLVLTFTKTDVTIFGSSNGTIDLTVSNGSGSYSYAWNDGAITQDRAGLIAGTYSVLVTDTTTGATGSIQVTISQPAQMVTTFVKTDATTVGGADGTIILTVTGGAGAKTFLWDDAVTTQNRSGLIAGSYTVVVTDTTSGETNVLTIEVSEPGAPPPIIGTIFEVPMLNDLQFVVDPITPNNCSSFQTLDNMLFADQFFPRFKKSQYFTPIMPCDTRIVQFNSDFPSHIVNIIKCDQTTIVKNFSFELREQNVGATEDFGISIRAHNIVGQSRIYFSVGAPPIPLQVGDTFKILNNIDGFNGDYAIVGIQQDNTLGVAYLIINKLYSIVPSTSSAIGRFNASTANFNVYESVIEFSSIPPGKYHVKITALDTANNVRIAISEPINVQYQHPKTNLIEYRGLDNSFDMTWTTGYIGRLRVESVLFKRLPGGERTNSRDSDFSLVNIAAKKIRGVLFEVYSLPPWLHEKLSTIFDCDIVFINGVQYRASEGWAEPEYKDKYRLAHSSIKLEQTPWFKKYNSDDIGTVGDGGFIETETGFIKR